jgi:hypothetical protein
MMKKILFVAALVMMFSALAAHGQDQQELIREALQIYTGTTGNSVGGVSGGFSLWGLVGGFLFGAIGFVAFIYGKRNSELKPMMIGIVLMVYPYFIRNTLVLYLIGVVLTAALYLL